MVLRLFPGDTNEDAQMIAFAAKICHTPLTISFEPGDDRTTALASLGCSLKKESLQEFLKSMSEYERIRTCGWIFRWRCMRGQLVLINILQQPNL